MFYYQGIDFIAQSNMLTQRVERQLEALRWFSNLYCPRIRFEYHEEYLVSNS